MLNFKNMLGYTNNAYIFEVGFNSSSNVFLTDNPKYSIKDDFLVLFPQFDGKVNEAQLNMFYTIADAAIKERRYHKLWKYLMGLYIAHLCTLSMMNEPLSDDAQTVINAAMPKGIATSKSVDGLSISYDFLGTSEDMKGYAAFKYTSYGQQLITYCKMFAHGGMWVNG